VMFAGPVALSTHIRLPFQGLGESIRRRTTSGSLTS
jgi:hypothetical protein